MKTIFMKLFLLSLVLTSIVPFAVAANTVDLETNNNQNNFFNGLFNFVRTILIGDVNEAPIIDNIPDMAVNQGDLVYFSFEVVDPEYENFEVTLEDVFSAGAELTWDYGIYYFSLKTDDLEKCFDYDFTVTALDGYGNVGFEHFTITILCDEDTDDTDETDDANSISNSKLSISEAGFADEILRAGETSILIVNVENEGNTDIEDLQVSVVAYDFALKAVSQSFDVEGNEEKSKVLLIEIPSYVHQGEYDLKITVSNNDVSSVTYRTIRVI